MNSIADRHTRSATIHQSDLMPENLLSNAGDPNRVFKRKIRRAFQYVDQDGSGDIDRHEFEEIMSLIKVKIKGLDLMAIFNFMDRQNRGVIELGDMEAFLEHSFSPSELVRVEMGVNLRHPQRFVQYHSWHVENRPFTFTLVPGFNNTEAHFEGSTDPLMCAKIKKDARLTFINMAYVARSEFVDIQVALEHSPVPLDLVFQNIDTIKRQKIMDSSGKFHKVTSSSDSKLSHREQKMFKRPGVSYVNPAVTKENVKQFRYQYHNHCPHCPPEAAWYLPIHLFMEDEKFSFFSKFVTWFIMSLIALSTVTYVFETLPEWESWSGWETIEGVVSIIFTVEFIIRIASCRNMLKYLRDGMNVIDICAVAPWWIEILTIGLLDAELLRVVRVIRLLRLVRLLKASSMQQTLHIFQQTILTSYHWLFLFLLMSIIALVVFASCMFVFEAGVPTIVISCNELTAQTVCVGSSRYVNLTSFTSVFDCRSECLDWGDMGCCSFDQMSGSCLLYNTSSIQNSSTNADYAALCRRREDDLRHDGTVSPFYEILNTIWCTCVTMMMVGYGDYYPISEGGRVVAACAGLMGLMCMAMSVIVVMFHFTISLVASRYQRLPKWMKAHLDLSGKGSITGLLKNVNKLCGLQMFKLEEELVLLSNNNQLNTARKLEQILSYYDGWAYLPFAYDDATGLPRISQFKLFALFALFGKKYQKDRVNQKKVEKMLSEEPAKVKDVARPFVVRTPSPFKFIEDESSDGEQRGKIRRSTSGKNVDLSSLVTPDYGNFSSPRKLEDFNIDDNSSVKSGAAREWSIELLSPLGSESRKKEEQKNRNCISPKEDSSNVASVNRTPEYPRAVSPKTFLLSRQSDPLPFSVIPGTRSPSRSIKHNSPSIREIISSGRPWDSGRNQRSGSGVKFFL